MSTKTLNQLLMEYDQLGLHIKQLRAELKTYNKASVSTLLADATIYLSRRIKDCEQGACACELRLKTLHQEIQQRRKDLA
jgi:hypothetical protein